MTANKRIQDVKAALGKELAVLGHHYQSDAIIRHTDLAGDSLELARRVPGLTARHVVFCGVFFMAETASILAAEGQRIHIPDTHAGCIMSAMAPERIVQSVIDRLAQNGRRIVPLTYVNSSAAVKAICGRLGGSVCTSANAATMMRWALERGDGVLFLPDKNLGHNTAAALGIADKSRLELDIRAAGRHIDPDSAAKAEVLLWPGLCAIHHRFKTAHIAQARRQTPEALVVVHPECTPEVVQAADAAGSTSRIIDFVAKAPAGSTIYVGTEINLVERLAARHAPDKTVKPLCGSCCLNMAKITESKLAATLESIETAEPVRVPEAVAAPARKALTRMLDACS